MARYRLLADCQLDGALCAAGTVIERPDEWHGPHRARRDSHDRVDVLNDNQRILGKLEDEPLYERVE